MGAAAEAGDVGACFSISSSDDARASESGVDFLSPDRPFSSRKAPLLPAGKPPKDGLEVPCIAFDGPVDAIVRPFRLS